MDVRIGIKSFFKMLLSQDTVGAEMEIPALRWALFL